MHFMLMSRFELESKSLIISVSPFLIASINGDVS